MCEKEGIISKSFDMFVWTSGFQKPLAYTVLYHVMHNAIWRRTQCYHTEQRSHVVAIFMLNNCHPITWELCVKYYYMVAASVSDVDHWWMQVLEVDVTGPWRFLCSKDRFDWGMTSCCVPHCEYWKFISPLSTDLPTLKRLTKTFPHRRIGSISMTLIEWTFLTQWPAVVLFSSATPDSKTGLL